MTTRTVTIALATYTGVDGVRRIGAQGEQVNVHADDVQRFDAVNGGGVREGSAPPPPTPRKQAPKKRAPRKRT